LSYQMLRMLLTKGRIEYLRAIVERFRVLVEREQGIYEAKVASPQLLDDATRKQLQDALEKYTSHRLKITWTEDPSLIGGVRFTYGDTLIDDSVKGKLGKLRQQLEMAAGQR
jgi:F-type H+-transporting ATPase subunit delta